MCCERNLHRPGFELRSVQPVAYATMLSSPHPPRNIEILELFTISDTAIQQYIHSITRSTLCMEHCFAQRQIRHQLLMIGAHFSAIMQLLWRAHFISLYFNLRKYLIQTILKLLAPLKVTVGLGEDCRHHKLEPVYR